MVHANITGSKRVITGRQAPYCLFTDPELARVGLSETEAKNQGISYRLFKVPMDSNLRARTLSEKKQALAAYGSRAARSRITKRSQQVALADSK